MSLRKAITFRFLSAQLTKVETHEFMNKLLDENGNIVITALFNHMMRSSIDGKNEADNINKLISKIILSRKQKEKRITRSDMKLDKLPRPLIGVTSSFLNQSDYINFSKTNRAIYLGSNTPNLLQKLDLLNIKNYSSINLSLFKSIKCITFNVTKLNEFTFPMISIPIMNNLKSVTLYAAKKHDFDIDRLINQQHIKMDNILKLSLVCFGSPGSPQNVIENAKFGKLLSKFPNTEYLHLYDVYAAIDADEIKRIFPNLVGFSLDGASETTNISLINVFGDNLNFLSFFSTRYARDYNLDKIFLNKLEQLKLWRPSNKSINDILKTAVNLRKIAINSTAREITLMTPNESKQCMTKLLISCKSLEYIEFINDGLMVQSVMDGIENGLFKTVNLKRKQMKIKIDITESKDKSKKISDEFMLSTAKIIHWLESSQINDFMFIWKLNEEVDLEKALSDLKENISSDVEIKQIDKLLVITNKDCRINGCIETWKMDIFW